MKDWNIPNKIYKISLWVMYAAWLNLLFIGGTVVGLVLFGWGPSLTALFEVMQEVFKKNTWHLPIFRLFKEGYKKHFFEANLIGYMLFLVGAILYYIFTILPQLTDVLFFILSIPFGAVASVFVVVCIMIFPVIVRYGRYDIQSIKRGIIIGLAHIHYIFAFVGVLVVLAFLILLLPGFFIFFIFSLPIILIAGMTRKMFRRIEDMEKKEQAK